jgi:hypothetical protein
MHLVPQPQNSDPSLVLRLVTERAQQLTRGTGAALALGHKRAMVCRASVGNAPRLGCQLDVSTGFSGECVRAGKALRCDDSTSDPRVDAEICRRLGIRSILAAPIPFEGEIVGLLEVFSSQRFAFHDGDLAVVENLAETALPAPLPPETTPPPNLLVEQEPAHRVFLANLIELVCPPQIVPLKLTSRPARFWPDVFVSAQLPWERFLQSMLLHVMMVATLFGILQFGIARPRLVPQDQLRFNKSDIIYYLPSEYLPLVKKGSGPLRSRQTLTYFKQPALSVRRESRSPKQTSIVPPHIYPKQDLRLLRIVGRNPTLPPVPLSATMREQLTTPAAIVAVVAPPPDTSALSRAQRLTAVAPAVINPAPPLPHSIRQVANLSIGQLQVVGPAPEMPIHEHSVSFGVAQRSLSSTQPVVVPPAPSVASLENARQRISSISDGATRVVPPAPLLPLAGDYLRGTPGGKLIAVVPPAPSVQGLDHSGNHYASSLPSAGMQVVPPAPTVTATGRYAGYTLDGIAIPAVPPAPSVDRLGYSGGQRLNSVRTGDVQIAAPPVTVQAVANSSKGGATIAVASGLPGGLLPGEIIAGSTQGFADAKDFPEPKELNVNFVGPALVLPASSYFLSYEVFIAEERLPRHQSRLIKLVYDFLPYQPRLSDYGPNYPAIENLRATRDPSCDETLMQVASSAKAVHWSQADRAQLSMKSAKQRQSSLPCYRTTADEYRRARARQHPN